MSNAAQYLETIFHARDHWGVNCLAVEVGICTKHVASVLILPSIGVGSCLLINHDVALASDLVSMSSLRFAAAQHAFCWVQEISLCC